MDKKILNQAEEWLLDEKDFLVPIKKIWQEFKDDIDFDGFVELIRGDDRFKIYEAKDEPWSEEDEEEMVAHGFYNGPRVMLVSRTPTKEEIAKSLADKMQKIGENLQKAHEAKPDGMSREEEEQLLAALKKTKELRDNIDKAFGDSELEN